MSSEMEEIPQFRPSALPQVDFLSELDSSDISDLEVSSHPTTPTTRTPDPVTAGTPATPMSELALSGSSFSFSDEETSTFAQPSTKRAYRKNVRGCGSQLGNQATKRRLFTTATSSAKKLSMSRSKSGLLKNTNFPQRPTSSDILIKRGEDLITRSMFVPHGAEVMNMDILRHVHVFTLQ